MAALKLPGWLHFPVRRRKSVAAEDLAALGAELGLDLSLAPEPVAPARTLPRGMGDMREPRRRHER